MDKNRLRAIIIAGVMGLLAAILTSVYLQQEKAKAAASVKPSVEEISVLQAGKDIPRGQTVEVNSVVLKRVPVNFVQPGALTSMDAAVGKMALADILSGEQVTSSKLASANTLPGSSTLSLSMMTPPGKRAITIPIDPLQAVGGMVRPGDYVDVLANFPVPQEVEGKQSMQLVNVTLFQNILVLAVGNQLREMPQASGRSPRGEAPAPTQPAQTITLALSPQEAGLISFAQEQGKLQLILRPPLDTQTQPLPATTSEALWHYILTTQGIQLPNASQSQPEDKQQKSPTTVEVYRGGKK